MLHTYDDIAGGHFILVPDFQLARFGPRHGFNEEARLELINLVYGPNSWLNQQGQRADALYLLGEISLEDDDLSGTIAVWDALIDEYPTSKLAIQVQEQIDGIRRDFNRRLVDLESSIEANRYLEIADEWLAAAEIPAPIIDISYIPGGEATFDWFNLIIERFPGTSHAELAYERMIENRTTAYRSVVNDFSTLSPESLIRMQAIASNGAQVSEEIFDDMQENFLDSDRLQRLRFLIGQAYWIGEDLEEAGNWFSKVIEEDSDANTYYRDLAFRRLQHLSDSDDKTGS